MKKFESFKDLIGHFEKIKATYGLAKLDALETSAKYVRDKAISKFGIYQDAAGPYSAWPELKSATQAQRERLGYEPNNPLYRSGDTAFSITYEITGDIATVGSPSLILLWQEFGTDKNGQQIIPPRSTLGAAGYESKDKIISIVGLMLFKWLATR